jgi:hypothetical protein
VDAGDELGDGAGLVSLGFVGCGELEVHLCRIEDSGGGREFGDGTDKSKSEMRGSLHYGGKCAASGRDDESLRGGCDGRRN